MFRSQSFEGFAGGNLRTGNNPSSAPTWRIAGAARSVWKAWRSGKDAWTYAARNLDAAAETPEVGLRRGLSESKEELGEADAAAEMPLDFLSPSRGSDSSGQARAVRG